MQRITPTGTQASHRHAWFASSATQNAIAQAVHITMPAPKDTEGSLLPTLDTSVFPLAYRRCSHRGGGCGTAAPEPSGYALTVCLRERVPALPPPVRR
jgi:hypothetical protein